MYLIIYIFYFNVFTETLISLGDYIKNDENNTFMLFINYRVKQHFLIQKFIF